MNRIQTDLKNTVSWAISLFSSVSFPFVASLQPGCVEMKSFVV